MIKRLPYTVLFVVIALVVMMGSLRPFLIETGQLTPFLTTRVFFHDTMSHGALGLVYYVAAFLQSCMTIPWLGAMLFTLLLTAIAYATRWLLRLNDVWFGVCWIAPFLLLTTYTRTGYELYVAKTPLTAFTIVLPLLLILLLLAAVRHFLSSPSPRKPSTRLWAYVLSAALFLGSGYYFWHNTYRDANFLSILRMKQAAERGEWQQVLTLSRQNKEVPTRLQVCLTRLALYKTGQMGDQLFAYPDGSANYNAPVQQPWLRLIGAPLLYYHYGRTGFAYRWSMEDVVEYGMRPASLRTLHRVALLNGEEALAAKYADALRHTLFHYDTPELLEQEAREIRPLLNYTDQIDGDDGLVEFYLLQSYALTEGGSREMVELSLMCRMITKQLDGFWPRFMALLPTWSNGIPRHYQEAALMVAQLQGGIDTSQLPIDDSVRQRFQRLVEASSQMGDSAGNAQLLRSEFGDTYWYYYFFVAGMKTT